MKKGSKIFASGHPRGPSMDFHNSGKDSSLHPGKSSTRGMNPAPKAHHTSPAAEYPKGHAGAKKTR